MKKNFVIEKSFNFALSAVYTFKDLQTNKEFILSKQFLRSATSVGANIREFQNAESKKDFIHKLFIAQKECDETLYWIDLLYHGGYLENEKFNQLKSESSELLKILKSIIVSTQNNMINSKK